MTRRELLAAWAAVIAGRLQPGDTAAVGQPAVPHVTVIDTHTHFYDPTRPQGVPWPPSGDSLLHRPHLPQQFTPMAAAAGVVGTVVVEASSWLEDNQWLLDLAGAHPVIVGIVGSLAPGEAGFRQHLTRFARHPLFRGIRLSARRLRDGLGSSAFEADMHRLADAGLALDLLGGAAMLADVATLARATPDLRVVIDHLPFAEWDGDPHAARRALGPLRDQARVYAKVSGVLRPGDPLAPGAIEIYRPRLDLLWEMFGRDRVVFGSNWPVSNRIASYTDTLRVVSAYVRARGAEDAERFFWQNSHAVYAWSWRAERAFPGGRIPRE